MKRDEEKVRQMVESILGVDYGFKAAEPPLPAGEGWKVRTGIPYRPHTPDGQTFMVGYTIDLLGYVATDWGNTGTLLDFTLGPFVRSARAQQAARRALIAWGMDPGNLADDMEIRVPVRMGQVAADHLVEGAFCNLDDESYVAPRLAETLVKVAAATLVVCGAVMGALPEMEGAE